MTALSGDITLLNVGIANVYLIRSDAGLTLLDTGSAASPEPLFRRLADLGYGVRDLDRIIVTHAHYDHAGGLAEVQAASGADVWAHELDASFIRAGQQAPRPEPSGLKPWDRVVGRILQGTQAAAPVHRELRGGDRLDDVLPGAEVVHLPGHSPGMIGLWFPAQSVLLGGDVVTHFLPWRLSMPVAAYTPDPAEARRSIRRAAALNPGTLGIGHGPALIGTASAHLNRLIRRFRPDASAQPVPGR